MSRKKMVLGIVVLVVFIILFLTKTAAKNDSSTKIALTSTEATINVTPSIESNAVLGTTTLPEGSTLVQTVVQVVATCSSSQKTIRALADDFYRVHQEKDVSAVLGAISQPYSQDEQNQLDFWLGTDNQNTPRLYQTPESNYSVTAYAFGTLQDRGQDFDERGSKRCQLSTQEDRTMLSTTPYTAQSVTRYLDFAIDAGGNVILTAFRATRDGEKYSGFGE